MFRKAQLWLTALILGLCFATTAMAADWQVVKLTGLVWIVTTDAQATRASVGMTLPENATVATAKGARAMLRHGNDILNVAPDTHIAPQARRLRGLVTVLMRQGHLDLDIEHRGIPRFAVQTPVVAAVVKGTQFSVDVVGDNAEVSVSRGLVQVTALAAGQAADVGAGQSARSAGQDLQVSGSGELPKVRKVRAQAPVVQAAAVSNAGGNGRSNAGGNGKSNAGGNDKRNAGGSSNSNAGGNSNSNAGGNGNSNAGGNGNGNGNGAGNGGGNST